MLDATQHKEGCPMVRPDVLTKKVTLKTKAWYDNMLSGSPNKHNCPCCGATLEFKEENDG